MKIEDKAEDAAELKKVAEMDAVNEESKAAVADILAKKKEDVSLQPKFYSYSYSPSTYKQETFQISGESV